MVLARFSVADGNDSSTQLLSISKLPIGRDVLFAKKSPHYQKIAGTRLRYMSKLNLREIYL